MIDSHSHIYTKPYRDDRDEVIGRAREAGIRHLLQVGCNLEDSKLAIELAEQVPGIFASVGVHPHDADTWSDTIAAEFRQMTDHPKVVAYGEIGLDFYYDNSPRDLQIQAFEKQMQLVQDLNDQLPVVIHSRDAEPETLEVLKNFPIERGGHVHCYTGTLETAKQILDLGYHIGFTGVITFKNAQDLREVVKMVPMDRMLIETDSPYLTPIPHRGKRNEPAFVQFVAEAIASIKAIRIEEVLEITDQNFYEVYGQPKDGWVTL